MPSQFQETDWYRYPTYYDIVFDTDTADEANFIEAAMARYGATRGKRLLEPGCGSGRIMIEMAKRGYQVSGVDINTSMLERARERFKKEDKKATLKAQPMQAFSLSGKFDAAYNTVSTFKYLLTEADAVSHLEKTADHLKEGGIYILGFHLTFYDRNKGDHERWVETQNNIQVTANIKTFPADVKKRIEPMRSRLSVNDDGVLKKFETNWEFRTYNARQVKSLLKKVPAFEPVAYHDFNYNIELTRELDDSQEDIILVLKKH